MKGIGTAHEPHERAHTLRRVDQHRRSRWRWRSWPCRRFVGAGAGRLRSARDWKERALTAETTGHEQQLEAQEERRVRDLILSTMDDGVLLIGRDAAVAFANDAIDRQLDRRPSSTESCRSRFAGRSTRVVNGVEPTSVLIETGVPARWLRNGHTGRRRRDARRRPRRDPAAPTRGRAAGLRRERLPRVEDTRRDHPGRRRDPRSGGEDDPEAVPRFASSWSARLFAFHGSSPICSISPGWNREARSTSRLLGAAVREEGQRLEERPNTRG